MFESNLLSQINTSSPLPTVVEVQFTTSINQTLYKAFQFAHTLLAEKSDRAAVLLPWSDEIYLALSGMMERLMLEHADTTFSEMIFALRRAEVDGPLAAAPPLSSSSAAASGPSSPGLRPGARGRYLRWLLLGPPPVTTPEERAMNFINDGVSSQLRVHASAPADAALLKAEHAPYGYLRFKTLSRRNKVISLLLLTLKPYLERKAEQWYVRNTDTSVDAVAMRNAYAYRYPHRAALLHFLAKYVYPIYHVMKQGSRFLYMMCFLLEMTPYTSPLHRVFGIALRRSTLEDSLATGPRAQRALLVARVVLILVFCGFRLLDFTRNADGASSPRQIREEGLPIPPPPVLGSDVPLPEDRSSLPKAGECPVCRRHVTNAAVCLISGIVGCYPCLQGYVQEQRACPVTHQSMGVEQIRRVFEC
ncbi:Pex2 / Pex12 amino terminal region family protein [Leishmania donovani]|uniref:Peroxin-12 n=1 Tax=Leishmania donovani TaxID=5661 RepID=A0A504XUG8_LEIDO|nr:Pex2 / Pex12 amino terminal region family protein [Leishmania donovani]